MLLVVMWCIVDEVYIIELMMMVLYMLQLSYILRRDVIMIAILTTIISILYIIYLVAYIKSNIGMKVYFVCIML